MATILQNADAFFRTARERFEIKLRRDSGAPWPWTKDPIMQTWRFTNVHREDDRTTVWFRENIREPIMQMSFPTLEDAALRLLEGTLIFRWFNRIETGAMVKDLLLYGWNTTEARERLTGISPIVTGAFIIKAGDGVSKLEGILNCVDQARPQLPAFLKRWSVSRSQGTSSLRQAWEDLRTLSYMGGFMSYEVVTDLRHTPILDQAIDIMTWGNLGPGAVRGIGRVVANNPELYNAGSASQRQMLALMAELLELSKDQMYWPQQWPKWEMHEVEMWLCEYAKYCNGQEGTRLKRRYSQS